jgi:hypothetical protein
MANPFQVNPPNVLQALMMGTEGFDRSRKMQREGQQDQARQFAANTLLNGGDSRSALARLLQGGDIAGANAVANFGNQASDQEYKQGMLKVAQQNAARQDVPQPLQILRAAGIDPASAEGRKALFPRTDTPISATDKKAIFEAEDAQPQLTGTIEALKRAKEINSQTFQGAGASARAWAGTKLPDWMVPDFVADPKTAKITEEWQKTMGPEALQSMANTLKGATTDFELKKFIDMLADPSTTAETRGKVIDRMIALSERKQKINDARIQDLRGGTYFKPPGQQGPASPQAAPQQGNAPKQAPDGNFYVPDPNRPGKFLQVVQ